MFVTSAVFDGNLGGLTAGDAACNTAASNAGLSGNYVAYLASLSSFAAERIDPTPTQFVRTDSVLVGIVIDEMDELFAPIDLDEFGVQLTNHNVWVGFALTNCEAWTTTNGSTWVGSGAMDSSWQHVGIQGCTALNHLYCFEQ